MGVTVVLIPDGRSSATQDARWFHGMRSISILVVNMLKSSSTLAVSVTINISIKLSFISVNGPRETDFVDTPPWAARQVN